MPVLNASPGVAEMHHRIHRAVEVVVEGVAIDDQRFLRQRLVARGIADLEESAQHGEVVVEVIAIRRRPQRFLLRARRRQIGTVVGEAEDLLVEHVDGGIVVEAAGGEVGQQAEVVGHPHAFFAGDLLPSNCGNLVCRPAGLACESAISAFQLS